MKNLFLCLSLILFGDFIAMSQNYVLKNAKQKRNKVIVCFYNPTDSVTIVPTLKNRIGLDSKFMYDGYFNINQDTLELEITSQVNKALYTITPREKNTTTNSELFYNDKKLKRRKTYRSVFYIEEIIDIKVINFNGKIITLN